MSFLRPTLSVITQRVETDITSRLTDGIPLLRNSVLKILARAIAGAIHLLYGFLQFLGNEAILVDRAFGIWLDRHAFIWGLTRKPATFSVGYLRFTGVDGSHIPGGTTVIRNDGIEFVTQLETTIFGGTAETVSNCKTAGSVGNTPIGVFMNLVTPISGVDVAVEVINPPFDTGVDIESDEALRDRILQRIQNPPAGGSAADYIGWATSIEGVFKAFVFSNLEFQGLGTVGVYVIDDDPDSPTVSGAVITDVQTYIDTVRPVTAQVTVLNVTPVVINFTVDDASTDPAIQAATIAAIKQLFQDEGIPGMVVLLSHIVQIGLQSGNSDFEIIAPAADVDLNPGEYPVLGTVTFV
jgi:uncharacterized phage protein gp47/JayE